MANRGSSITGKLSVSIQASEMRTNRFLPVVLAVVFSVTLSVAAAECYLFQLTPIKGSMTVVNDVTVNGAPYSNAMVLSRECEWHLGNKYDILTVQVALTDECPSTKARVTFLVESEDREAARIQTRFGTDPKTIKIPLGGVLRLKLSSLGNRDRPYMVWINPVLKSSRSGYNEPPSTWAMFPIYPLFH